MFSFGQFSHEKRLAKALRRRPLEPDAIKALDTAVNGDHRFRELPDGLLWKLQAQAKTAMDEVTEASPIWRPLYNIFRSSLGEVQNRYRAC